MISDDTDDDDSDVSIEQDTSDSDEESSTNESTDSSDDGIPVKKSKTSVSASAGIPLFFSIRMQIFMKQVESDESLKISSKLFQMGHRLSEMKTTMRKILLIRIRMKLLKQY